MLKNITPGISKDVEKANINHNSSDDEAERKAVLQIFRSGFRQCTERVFSCRPFLAIDVN